MYSALVTKDFFNKPWCSLIVLGLLLLYKLINIFDFLKIKIRFSIYEKLILQVCRLCRDQPFLLKKISFYSHPIYQPKNKYDSPIEIHSIVSHEVLSYYIVMAKSFQHFSEIRPQFVVHEDGSFTKNDCVFLNHQLPNSTLITFKQSTQKMKQLLKKFPILQKYRLSKHNNKINIMTTVDIPYYTKPKDVFYMDGDILFFNRPAQLCRWLQNKKARKEILFMRDHSNVYVVSERVCKEKFGVCHFDRFNMGILCYPKSLFNLRSINTYFKLLYEQDKDDIMVRDQTYFMIHFQKEKQKMKVLNEKKYFVYGVGYYNELYLNQRQDDTICCHYTSTVRHHIYKNAVLLMFRMKNLF